MLWEIFLATGGGAFTEKAPSYRKAVALGQWALDNQKASYFPLPEENVLRDSEIPICPS